MTRYTAPLCPTTPEHGPLLDWPTGRYGFHCSHQGHDGRPGTPPSRAFFTTAEATSGIAHTAPVAASQPATPTSGTDGHRHRFDAQGRPTGPGAFRCTPGTCDYCDPLTDSPATGPLNPVSRTVASEPVTEASLGHEASLAGDTALPAAVPPAAAGQTLGL